MTSEVDRPGKSFGTLSRDCWNVAAMDVLRFLILLRAGMLLKRHGVGTVSHPVAALVPTLRGMYVKRGAVVKNFFCFFLWARRSSTKGG